MRNRYKKTKDYPKVAEVIGRNYIRLQSLCHYRTFGLYGSRSYEDIFQDTVIYVIQDEVASSLPSDEAIIDHFCHRYRMIEYQTIQDAKQLKEIPYADYLQTKKETTEER